MEKVSTIHSRKPDFGWTVKMNHVFPKKGKQKSPQRIRQIFPLIPLILRYLVYYVWRWLRGKLVIMDFVKPLNANPICGVPIGGIGGGSIGRGWKGEFCNFQMRPGIYDYNTVHADQFILTILDESGSLLYQNVLSPNRPPKDGSLSKWKWNFPADQAEYTALYPRSWTTYNIKEYGLTLVCRQISPVIPNNYKDSCLPGCVFVWSVENRSDKNYKISITFTFKNGTGSKEDKKGECSSSIFGPTESDNIAVYGVELNQTIHDSSSAYTIACQQKNGVTASRCPYFDPKGNGEDIWKQLASTGKLEEHPATCTSKRKTISRPGKEHAVAVCLQALVGSANSQEMEFSLVWDMPVIKFGGHGTFNRYYTKHFPSTGNGGPKMCEYGLTHYREWEEAIYNWQLPVLEDKRLPAWFKSALFNETYYITDGGTVWLLPDKKEDFTSETDPRAEFGRFGYLEGHEYRMYNTYDVHFYASFALAHLWPKLQASIQYDYRDTILLEDRTRTWFLYNGEIGMKKKKSAVPHDMGDPEDEPYRIVNAYNVHDVSEWRDLNLKFVLQCYRDYCQNKNVDYLKDMWTQLNAVVDKAKEWDTDGDGMIENSNSPDQTYDCWTMNKTSAYCGGLWVASLFAMHKMAEELDSKEASKSFKLDYEKAKNAYQAKLWNGLYYDFDSSKSSHSSTIMSDQLCGLWYLCASGVTEEVFPEPSVESALQMIYKLNVQSFCKGEMGAVNGMKPDGSVDRYAIQSEEVWTGVTYGLAALFIHKGMNTEAFSTAQGIYNTVYNEIGLGFQTPEALYENCNYRSIGYMRPLSIWSIYNAWIKTNEV